MATRCCWPPESWPGYLVGLLLEADPLQQLQAALGGLVPAASEHLDLGDRQVLGNGHVREQLEVLEYHADAGAQLGQVGLRVADGDVVDEDLALLKGLESVHALDERGFARAGGSADDDDLAFLHLGRAFGQHLERAVPLADVLHFDHGHVSGSYLTMAMRCCRFFTKSERLKLMTK